MTLAEQVALLRIELAKPEYAGMSAQQAADALNAPRAEFTTTRDSISAAEFVEALDWTELEALTAAQRARLQIAMFAGSVPATGKVKALLDSLFPSGATRTALVAAFKQLRSWAEANGVEVSEVLVRRIRAGQELVGESWT